MADKTKIEWADASWSPIRGCSRVGPGCDHCWAARFAHRQNHLLPGYATRAGWTGKVELIESTLEIPLRRRKPTRYAVALMGDLFHPNLPDSARDRIFAVMALCPQHTFIVLTKRWERMMDYMTNHGEWSTPVGGTCVVVDREWEYWMSSHPPFEKPQPWPPPNIILGVSAWDQASAEEACGWQRKTPAACRLLCLEPLLGAIDLSRWIGYNPINEEIQRTGSLQGGEARRTGDRLPGPNLENRKTRLGQMERLRGDATLRQGEGRTSDTAGLPSDLCDVRECEGLYRRSSPRVAALQWADPQWRDDQSQEREEGGQSAREPRTGYLLQAGTSCASCSEGGPYRPERREECDGETDSRRRSAYTGSADGGRTVEVDREGSRDRFPDSFQDRSTEKLATLDFVIVAGETGAGARPMHPHWVRAIRDQCQAAGVPFWFKAWGSWVPSTYDGVYHNPLCDGPQFSPRAHGRDCHDFGDGYGAVRLKRAGRLLDGREHNERPEVQP